MKNNTVFRIVMVCVITVLLFVGAYFVFVKPNSTTTKPTTKIEGISEDIVPGYLFGKMIYITIEEEDFIDYEYINKIIYNQEVNNKELVAEKPSFSLLLKMKN